MDRDSLKALLDQGLSVEKIAGRFGKHPSTVSYWMRKYRLEAANRQRHAARGAVDQANLEHAVAEGLSITELAERFDRSKATIRHWLRRYRLRTQNVASCVARDTGERTIRMHCGRHGEAEFVLEGRGTYRCKRCRAEHVVKRRRKVKRTLVAEAGGCCRLCGYDRYLGALQFHHLEPSEKRIGLSYAGTALALSTLRAEAAKCVLLCANCHAEVEGGVASIGQRTSASG